MIFFLISSIFTLFCGKSKFSHIAEFSGVGYNMMILGAKGQENVMELRIKTEENEYWWGGSSTLGEKLPLSRDSTFYMDRSYTENQTMPLWLSTRGRYVYGTAPIDICCEQGEFTFRSDGEIILNSRGLCLRDAYLNAMNCHFPFHGSPLNQDFFRCVQYNTWIEYQYHPAQQAVLDYAQEILDHGFAPGILIIDEGWQKGYGQWQFDPAAFPDPGAMVKRLHDMGFKVLLWIVPTVRPDGEFFIQSLREQPDLFMRCRQTGEPVLTRWWNGCSALLNLANPSDESFLRKQLDLLMEEYGIDGFKFDGGNADMYDPCHMIGGEPDTPLSCYELNQAYNRFACTYEYHELKDSYGCGGLLQIQRLRDKWHRYDGEGLRSLIPDGAIAGLLGHPFICPDMVGGGDYLSFLPGSIIDGELFVRWAQCSACFPMMQYSKKPWTCLSEEHCRLVLEAGRLHDRLTDYILLCIKESQKTGEPVLRLLEYSYPHMGYETIVDEFLLGEHILAAPVLSPGVRRRRVAFPPGVWTDQQGNLYEGGTALDLEAPLDRLLWFWHR